jgi:hypothetical protein
MANVKSFKRWRNGFRELLWCVGVWEFIMGNPSILKEEIMKEFL